MTEHDRPVAQLVPRDDEAGSVQIEVTPDATVEAVAQVLTADGGREIWSFHDQPVVRDGARKAGLSPIRQLLQMRVPLPVEAAVEISTRPFAVGHDEMAWLDVNNRAFHWHPEQSGWTLDHLRQRFAEPWFDPDGFLLLDVGDQMAGFCWTKEHRDADPPLGEIYVIATNPDFSGRGFGAQLTAAGLNHLHRRGLKTGMLYVESDNERAVAMYERMGFTTHHRDVVYRRHLDG